LAKIKILYIISGTLFDNNHRKLLSVIRNLNSDKYEFNVVCSENILLLEHLKNYNIPVYVIGLPGRISTKLSHLIQKLQDGEKFNIVHSFGLNAGIYSRLLKKSDSNITCIHSPASLTYIEKENFLTRQVTKTTEQYLAQFTNILICENNTDMKLAVKNKFISINRASVIPSSVDMEKFANRKKDAGLLSTLGLNKEYFIIGNVSNFNEFENQQVIIRSVYYLSKKYPDIRYLFIGTGKTLGRMKDLVKNSSLNDFITFIDEKINIEDYYALMDLFILSDSTGGSQSILLEAMASRLPVICSLSGSYLNITKDEYNSFTFDPMDMDDIFEKTCYLIENKQQRDVLAQNAMIDATQFDDSVIFPKIEALYNPEPEF
jgi:glycosyltransferase involved in cell wall biosynthesis